MARLARARAAYVTSESAYHQRERRPSRLPSARAGNYEHHLRRTGANERRERKEHTNIKLGIPGICLMLCALASAFAGVAAAQAFGTTTVQGTVYLANGAPGFLGAVYQFSACALEDACGFE